MILVLFGTNRYPFDRLAKAVENLAENSPEEVIVQLGYTFYHPHHVKSFDFLPRQDLLSLISRADVVITHGGFATISDCLGLQKKIIAFPRRNDGVECYDSGSGQEEIVRQLEKEGKLVGVYDERDLPGALEKARLLNTCKASGTEIPNLILDFVKAIFGEAPQEERSGLNLKSS